MFTRIERILGMIEYPSGDWEMAPGQECHRLMREVGPEGVEAVAGYYKAIATSQDPSPILLENCLSLIAASGLPEAETAMEDLLIFPMDREVTEFYFERAADYPNLWGNAKIAARAVDLHSTMNLEAAKYYLDCCKLAK